MVIFSTLAIGLLGSFFGSFAGAQVWRLRARQLRDDAEAGETVDRRELGRLTKIIKPVSRDRSECLHCHHTLAWYDLVPLFSWLSLGGKCRYCHQSIGKMEILLEIGLGLVFAASVIFWPFALNSLLGWLQFAVWLVACILMAILFAYDAKWYLLPFAVNISLIGVGLIFALLSLHQSGWSSEAMMSLLGAVTILAGLYFVFSLFGWSGQGDSILGVGLALLLGNWQLAFLTLFLANLIGCLALIPIALSGNLHRSMRVPFGPFLISGTVIAVLWGSNLIDFFLTIMSAPVMALMV